MADREAPRAHWASFARSCVDMRNREFLTDVVVVCDTRTFPAHAHILCAGSLYFYQQISNIQSPIHSLELRLPSVSADVFETVLDFLYTGVIPSDVDNNAGQLTNLVHAARTLQISELYNICIEHLHRMLSSRYFVALWNLSLEFGETGRVARVLEYVASNFEQASTCVDFLKLTRGQLDQLFQHPGLNRMNVDAIIKGIMEWIKYDSDTRREHLQELLSAFNVYLVSNEYIKVLLNSEPLVKENATVYFAFVTAASTRLLGAQPLDSTWVRPTDTSQIQPATGPKLICFGKRNNMSTVTVFDRQTCTWSTARPLPLTLSEGTVIAAYQNNLYFVGGGHDAYGATDTIIQYSVINWRLISLSTLSSHVWKAGVGVLNDKMYVVGGMNRQNVVTNCVQCYNFNDQSCAYVASTNTNYCLPIVTATLNFLFAVGSLFHSTVEKYDPLSGQWTVIIPTVLSGLSPRATACMQQLYVINDVLEHKFAIFNPEENRWHEETYVGGPDEITGMWSMCQANSRLPYILVRDGRKCVFSYCPDNKQWHLLAVSINNPWNWWQTVLMQ